MADGTRLHQLADSIKECQDAITRKHTHNTSIQTQLTEVTDMLRTLLTNRPPLEVPTLGGLDNHRPHHPDRRDDWDDRETRRQVQDEDDLEFPPEDRRIQARTLRLDFPRFDGENPSGWSYKVNQFFDYY